MKKYEISRVIQERLIENINNYDEYSEATRTNGSRTIEAPNLFRAVVMARKMETADYDDAIANRDNYYYYPDWLEVWEVNDGAYTSVRRYVLPMRDM